MLYICNVDEESVQNGNEMSQKVSDYAQKKITMQLLYRHQLNHK